MATKHTTKQIVASKEVVWETWFHILEARVRDLANDSDHTLAWKDRAALNKSVTRRQIVTIYETAYSELAESFVGHLERINELANENNSLQKSVSNLEQHLGASDERLNTALRRINGLLELIEQPVGL